MSSTSPRNRQPGKSSGLSSAGQLHQEQNNEYLQQMPIASVWPMPSKSVYQVQPECGETMISVHLPESRGMCKTIISACSNDNLIVNISFLVAFLYTDTKTKDYIYIL